MPEHETLVWFSKTFGLFYLIAFAAGVLAYTYWPSNKRMLDEAAAKILNQEDRP